QPADNRSLRFDRVAIRASQACVRSPSICTRTLPRGIAEMAVLTKHPEGTHSPVLSPHLVGRSRLADLRMNEPTVSGEHAVLRWTGREWELHDLGSRNGTIVDGRRLAP